MGNASENFGTLREFVRSQNEERRDLLQAEIYRAEARAGRSLDSAKIRSVAEMGEAAGRCHMCSKEIEIRADIVTTERGIREELFPVLIHEGRHAEGDGLEGMTELFTTLQTGRPPVPAYRNNVTHAEHIAEVVGRQQAFELAKKPEARVLLLQDYIKNRVQRGAEISEAQQEGEEHIRLAA